MTIATKTSDHDSKISHIDECMLHPDATYKEQYGDVYFDGAVKYLYPTGYQSMRPQSGLWRLSVLVLVAFAILDTFVVSHCYDCGIRKYYIDGFVNDIRCNNRKTNIVKHCYDRGVRKY